MKKFALTVITVAAVLSSLRAEAQEFELTVTPRAEGVYTEADHFTWGSSALYTFLDGQLGDSWSFSVSNHWLSDGPKYLYKNTRYANENDWLDWAYVGYTAGDWEFNLGKNTLALGSMEMGYDDVDCYDPLMSLMWNDLPVYQWGGQALYNISDSHSVDFQLASSPFVDKYFKNLFMTLGWNGTFGSLSNRWALSYDTGERYMLSLGHRYDLSDALYATVDFYNIISDGLPDMYDVVGAVRYQIDERFGISGSIGYYNVIDDNMYGGIAVDYKPFAATGGLFEDLRVHLYAAHNRHYYGEPDGTPLVFSLGVTCPLTFTK